jgi:hypothetical protein
VLVSYAIRTVTTIEADHDLDELVLQQLAENAPTLLFARIKDFFDLIWGPLWDAKDKIRFAASRALSSCLAVLVHRTYHLGTLDSSRLMTQSYLCFRMVFHDL